MPLPDHSPIARPFTGMALDRAMADRKDPARLEQLLEDPTARAVAAGHDGVLMSVGSTPSLVRTHLTPQAVREPVLLGLDEGQPLFAVDLDILSSAARAELTRSGKIVSLREAGAVLEHSEAGLAAYVAALLNWHRGHHFCANCGAVAPIAEAGYSRRCPVCETVHFLRTDPAVIMTVEHQGRLLLGRRAGWPPRQHSVLAGFVSPGESAEEAVIREVGEESGVVARDPTFVRSQPWPFPSSLMLGFEAQSDGGEPQARDDELEEVGWFDLDEVRAALAGDNPELRLPPSISIARFLIERWVAGASTARSDTPR